MAYITDKAIDIVTTATLRPQILRKTYSSFCNHLFKGNRDKFRLILNVDPVGDHTYRPEDVISEAKKFFPNMIANVPKEGHFTKAVMWCWNQVEAEYVFQLEDDWVLMRPLDINVMIHILDAYPKIASVRLFKGQWATAMTNKLAKRHFSSGRPYKCSYASKKDKRRFQLYFRTYLNPSLYRGDYIKQAVKIMTPRKNPEAQLVAGFTDCPKLNSFANSWDYAVLTPNGVHRRVVRDIGRGWRVHQKIYRNTDFVKWKGRK